MKRETRKTHCFIDYENVHESGFEGVESLSDGDAVTIFISSASHKISLVVLETLLRKKCELNIIHTIGTGKNNLDFQLIAEVGFQIGRHTYEAQTTQFAVISKDRGYENVVTAFLNRGFQIIQCDTIQKIMQNVEEMVFEPMEDAVEPEWEFGAPIRKCLASLKMSASDLKRIDAIFKESLSLNVLHDRLVKVYGKKGNHPIYGKLKSIHKQYQKTLPPVDPDIYQEMPWTAKPFVAVQDLVSEKQAEDEPKSLDEFWDQLLEESGEGGTLPGEDLPHVSRSEDHGADSLVLPEKTASEVKKKTRGRKRKQPAAKSKMENELNPESLPESEGENKAVPVIVAESEMKANPELKLMPESQAMMESEALLGAGRDEITPELPEKQVEKKKRRPGRPRKKNGTGKPAESRNIEEPAEPSKHEVTKDSETT